MNIELPFKSEYAKSGRARCKGCKESIAQESLRIAAMVQSAFHDSKQPNWFHEACFFKKQRPQSVGDIDNFVNLRFEDQERLKQKVGEISTVIPSGSGSKKGQKRSKTESAALNDFGIEYAKSGRAACRGCELKILKDQVRIRKTVYDTEVGMKYGGQPLWHHLECFAQLRSELGWFERGECLPGFKTLKKDDQVQVAKELPAVKSENPASKKPKIEDDEDDKQLKTVQSQSKCLFMFRDCVKNQMSKNDIHKLLEHNNQEPVVGDSEKLLDQLADMLTFGAISACPQCNGQQLLFNKSGYLCNGQLTEWTKCANLIKEPKRSPCKIPKSLVDTYEFLKQVKKKPEIRVIRYIPPSSATISKNILIKKEDELDGPKIKRERPPLYNLRFAHIGLKDKEKELKDRLIKLGGILESKIHENTIAVFSTPAEVKRLGSKMEKVKVLGIHIVPINYLDSVESNASNAISYINSMSLCDWGTDPFARVPKEDLKSSKSKSIYTKSMAKSITLKVKDGLAVDPESGLQDLAHVYVDKAEKYNVVLGLTDIQRNKNSYYKLQLLESDNKNRFWVFRSWGRIGTTIGDHKLEKFDNLLGAKESFVTIYRDKTGNEFYNKENFIKVPGRMYPIDVEYEEDKKVESEEHTKIKSKLDPRVQALIKLLFDMDTMKRTMMLFDLDTEKMPLGKLSQKQIQSAYKVLTEIYELIQKESSNASFIDATNRFYTLIPHSFGVETPPIIDTVKQIEQHRQVLDSLSEIEYAYNLIRSEDVDENLNPLDKHYEKLKTDLQPLKKDSDEFKILEQYVYNTHGETHKMYKLEIVDIFKVARQGENRRYKPFKKLHNRKLLWHGSRLTNFAGILSHGLKIAPPEAPVTGYMFGKGIYFADMVSKSANYCCTSKQDPTGLMLLSEVALGNMMECTNAKYVTELPKDKHSTFGRGRTMPDPKESFKRDDGVEIPIGKPNTDSSLQTSLLYNEYIVYDIAQVNIQYLFVMNFKYNY